MKTSPAEQTATDDPFQQDFWRRQAALLDWHTPFTQVAVPVDQGPRCRWFVGGETNICHNALDRHLPHNADKTALIHCDYAGNESHVSYQQLFDDVQAMAWLLAEHGVQVGDRVVIFLPMIPQVAVSMLACARLGAIHVTIYAAAAAEVLAQRISDCEPTAVIYCADPRGRDEMLSIKDVCRRAGVKSAALIDIANADIQRELRAWRGRPLPCRWLAADAPTHILYTSGTTGKPKGIVRDGAGYSVALLSSLKHLFRLRDDEIFFTSADAGWVTGHSYGVYGPLLAGITTVMLESSALNKPGPRWWHLIEHLGITRMLTIPGAMRLARQRQENSGADLSRLRAVYLAGEPLDRATREWVERYTGVAVQDHYWQTESGWPMLAGENGELSPVFSRRVRVLNASTGEPCADETPGMLVVDNTLGPGGMTTLWQDDVDHDQRYWRWDHERWCYFTHDYAVRRQDGTLRVLGRLEDVINVGGIRLSTAEVEQAILGMTDVAEVAAVGVAHPLLGQMVGLYAVTPVKTRREKQRLKKLITRRLIEQCGRHALPRHIYFVAFLPRTFSGKLLRRMLA